VTRVTVSGFASDFIANANDLPYVLFAPLVYHSALLDAIVIVPAGFQTDLASIPRFVQPIIPKEGKYNRAAVVHDWLYTKGRIATPGDGRPVSRGEADGVLLEASRVLHVRETQAIAIYAGVRLGGWHPWGRYRKAETGA
jgi:hypothetical protein